MTIANRTVLSVEHSQPTRHHFHSPNPESVVRAINAELVEARQMYVYFGGGVSELVIEGPAAEIEAWALRLLDYVRSVVPSEKAPKPATVPA